MYTRMETALYLDYTHFMVFVNEYNEYDSFQEYEIFPKVS